MKTPQEKLIEAYYKGKAAWDRLRSAEADFKKVWDRTTADDKLEAAKTIGISRVIAYQSAAMVFGNLGA